MSTGKSTWHLFLWDKECIMWYNIVKDDRGLYYEQFISRKKKRNAWIYKQA